MGSEIVTTMIGSSASVAKVEMETDAITKDGAGPGLAGPLIDQSVVDTTADRKPGLFAALVDRIERIYATESGPSRIVPMEGLRGWAVLLVFFVHFHGGFKGYVSPNSFLFHVSEFLGTVGGTGVDLFFIISGYLIYGAVVRPRFTYSRFLRRRVQRIYPTFLVVSLMFIALWIFSSSDNFKFHGTTGQQALYLTQNLLLMPGIFRVPAMNVVAWSLSYEMFFYLLLPLLLAVTGMRRWTWRARVSCFVGLAALGILISPLFAHPRIRLVGFLFGIVLFEVVERFRNRSSNFTDLAALGAYSCGVGLIYAIEKSSTIPGQFVSPMMAVIAGVTSFAFCGFCFHGGGLLSRVFSWSPLRWLGNMSYSYYLIHALALGVVRQTLVRIGNPGAGELVFVSLLLCGLIATWVASTLLFVAIEKPLSIQAKRVAAGPLPSHVGV
jgi:peptidoglycan/LPS O-acetylase OafA/YrhL